MKDNSPEAMEQLLQQHNVILVSKADSRVMKFLNAITFWNNLFETSFWTTVVFFKWRLIGYPTFNKNRMDALKRPYTIRHEIKHVNQADRPVLGSRRFGNLCFVIKYLFLYFPIIGAWFRYDYEVEAYVTGYRAQIEGEGWTVEREKLDEWVEWVSQGLWKYYLWTIPPSVTRKRLKRELSDLYAIAV